ncbi:disease resistance RPP13-like protein 4 [Ziziphus jujuba]|uniref:Disease resistance RPP13-like protein 4 n=1 Tax=Ziziphus jujuba TaxID=326968 RepID=A0A6P3ZBK5_ZIZJJ|nr:disease resistance RPP13-like protein 4 [Ziziphus jujuba]
MSFSTVSSLTNTNANSVLEGLDKVIGIVRTVLDRLECSKPKTTTNANQQSADVVDTNQPQPHTGSVASSSNANQQAKSVGVVDNNQRQSQSQTQPMPIPNSGSVASSSNANQQAKSAGVVDNNQSQSQSQPMPIPNSGSVASSSNANQQAKSFGVVDNNQSQTQPMPIPNSGSVASSSNDNQEAKSVGVVDNNQSQTQPMPIPNSGNIDSTSNANQQDDGVGIGNRPRTQIEAQPFHDSNTIASSSDANQQNKSNGKGNDYQRLCDQFFQLERDLSYIKNAFINLNKFEQSALNLLKSLERYGLDEQLSESLKNYPSDDASQKRIEEKLGILVEIVMRLKLQIPSLHKISSMSSEIGRHLRMASGNDAHHFIAKLSKLHSSPTFKDNPHFKDFRVIYNSLDVTKKLCLLCFAAFPANEVVNKRLLVYWWHGEGFVEPPVDGEKTIMDVADEIFLELEKKGCIEPIKTKRGKLSPDGYRMHLVIHCSVSVLAKEARFFDFDNGSPTPTVNFATSYRASLDEGQGKPKLDSEHVNLRTIFNLNQPYPDFELEWFSKLRNVKVLSLGRWQDTAKKHIEVEGVEFLKGLSSMKHLRFFSLQGISTIAKLPDAICTLSSLRILDLRACHNLEVLPDGIGSLKKLTHLDISKCYLLDYMPKGIAMLSELQVLKGFVIGDDKEGRSCPFNDLSSLLKLKKLSINTSRQNFPSKEELNTLRSFGMLQNLTIAWGGISFSTHQLGTANDARVKKNRGISKTPTKALTKLTSTLTRSTMSSTKTKEPFKELRKLDLQCYPLREAPNWLIPRELKSLKKLYIRGGELQDLPVQEISWESVQILRLKFLRNLRMDWIQLKESFPELTHLEKVKCPKLTFFPCDEGGIWVSDRSSV